jgi:hypothetical protein
MDGLLPAGHLVADKERPVHPEVLVAEHACQDLRFDPEVLLDARFPDGIGDELYLVDTFHLVHTSRPCYYFIRPSLSRSRCDHAWKRHALLT